MVRNSVAIQHGADPERAELRFHYGRDPDGAPASFFPERGDAWRWPQQAVMVDGVLTLFLYELTGHGEGGLGFAYAGWSALRVTNPQAEPGQWTMRELATPDTGPIAMVGVSVIVLGDHVLAYGVREPGDHAVLLLRWSRAAFVAGELHDPQVWSGPARGWSRGPPVAVADRGQTEFSVVPDRDGGFLMVQTLGFGAAALVVRQAPAPTGPFGDPRELFVPPEGSRRGALVYAARAHPEQPGADLVLTYATNSLDPQTLMQDMALYFPRFLRLEL
jgi:hypothetical protein